MPSDYQVTVWPIGRWKGWDLRRVPVAHLNWFLEQPIKANNSFWIDWRNKVVQELERRHSYLVRFHFSEHLYERFTQYWPRFISHYQGLVNKEAGIVTILRRLVARALENGIVVPDRMDIGKFIIIDKWYRWVYQEYQSEMNDNFKFITLTKIKKDSES